MVDTTNSCNINLTANAMLQIDSLLQLEDNPNIRFRVYIVGGGCSGFEYGFMFDKEFAEDDYQIEQITNVAGNDISVPIVIDSMSYPYLKGATVDYIKDLQGSRFKIDNPNADTTCSCGSSFSIKDQDS